MVARIPALSALPLGLSCMRLAPLAFDRRAPGARRPNAAAFVGAAARGVVRDAARDLVRGAAGPFAIDRRRRSIATTISTVAVALVAAPWVVRHGVGSLAEVEQTATGGAVAGAFDQDEADQLNHTDGGTVSVGGAPGQARVAGRHLGFDTHTFPGVGAMRAWKTSGAPYEWVGYYLPSPCHRDRSWSGRRPLLDSLGFGTAVIYVGQQTWGRTPHPGSRGAQAAARHGLACNADFVSGARGAADGDDAARVAAAEGFVRGTIVFLDVERMERMPDGMRDYYRAWAARVLADGRFRPGVYVHAHNAPVVHDDLATAYAAAGLSIEPPVWVASGRGFTRDKFPGEVGQAFAGVWQGVLDVVENHGGVRLPIDVNVASVPSPSARYAAGGAGE